MVVLSKGIIYICPSFYLVEKEGGHLLNTQSITIGLGMLFECKNDRSEYQECTEMFQCLYNSYHSCSQQHSRPPPSDRLLPYRMQKVVGKHYLYNIYIYIYIILCLA